MKRTLVATGRIWLWVWICCLGGNAALHAATYEVAGMAANASDDGPGTMEHPWKTLSKAALVVSAGDTVLIRHGVYRESVVITASGKPEAPIEFRAAPGAHVVVTGADELSGWRKVEGPNPVFQVPWPYKFITWSKAMTHPGDDYHRLIGRCEQVMIDGYFLRQVLQKDRLAPGTFYADISNQTLQVWDRGNRDLNKSFAEGSVRQELIRVEGAYVRLRGIVFRYAANMAQHGAVALKGNHDAVEDCTFERMNSSGATFAGPDQVVRRCVFRENGQLGFGANGAHRLLLSECLVEDNNIKGFDRGWEAGGDKIVLTRDAVFEHSRFVRNRGHGLWFDIGNENCTVRQCYIADNEDSGIFYEISFGLQAKDNVITRNGFAHTAGAWGAQAGVSVSSSPGCVVERNLIVGNREGFNFREQTRSTPRIGKKGSVAVWNHDETIRSNVLAFNRDGQIRGWFDVKDNRHWNKAMDGAAPASGGKPADIAAPYQGSAGAKQPEGLTLEQLRLRFAGNIYWAAPGQKWFEWGVTWGRHKSFNILPDFQRELGIDEGSRVLDPQFADLLASDYRLKPDVLERLRQAYPQGSVPGVILGVQR